MTTEVVRKLVFFNERATRIIENKSVFWARSSVIAVLKNQWTDEQEDAISAAASLAEELGSRLAPRVVAQLGVPVITYGKAIILGSDVSEAVAAAIMHKRIGKPIRTAVGGGKAVIPSNMKRGTLNTMIDVPLGHKDDPWAFFFAETLTVALADAPKPDEFVLCLAVGGEMPS